MTGDFWERKGSKIVKALGRFIVKSLGTAIALTFQASFFELLGPMGIESKSTQQMFYGVLTLVFGPIFWWVLQKVIAHWDIPGGMDSADTFIKDACLLFSQCVAMNQAWAFKSLVSAFFSKFHADEFLTRLGVQATVLWCCGTLAFWLRNCVYVDGPLKENIEKPPKQGFSLFFDAYVLAMFGSFPLVTGFYTYASLQLWWTDLVGLLGIQRYIEVSSWVMVMERGTFFFMVSAGAKAALYYQNGSYKIDPLDSEKGIHPTKKPPPPKESSLTVKSITLAYSWAMAYTLDMFWFDDMNGCRYDPKRSPAFPNYCSSLHNFEFSVGITLCFVVLTFANAMTQETTWFSHYDKKLHSAAFPTIVGWAWASFVNSHLSDLSNDIKDMQKHHPTSEWANPAFYLATWAFLLAAGAGTFNLYKNVQRDLEAEHGEAAAPKIRSVEGDEYEEMPSQSLVGDVEQPLTAESSSARDAIVPRSDA